MAEAVSSDEETINVYPPTYEFKCDTDAQRIYKWSELLCMDAHSSHKKSLHVARGYLCFIIGQTVARANSRTFRLTVRPVFSGCLSR